MKNVAGDVAARRRARHGLAHVSALSLLAPLVLAPAATASAVTTPETATPTATVCLVDSNGSGIAGARAEY